MLRAVVRPLGKEARSKGEKRAAPPYKARFGWLTPAARAWREKVKQTIIVLNLRWAWRMAKLFPAAGFVVGEWQDQAVRTEIENHKFDVLVLWLAGGGDSGQEYWWHVTELTLDHLRPSPKCIKEREELASAKECETMAERGLEKMAKRRRKEEEKLRMLREVAELFKGQTPAHANNCPGSRTRG